MSKSSFSKTLIAGIFGASIALLFAPKPGKELRNNVKDEIDKLKEQGKERIDLLVEDFKQSYHETEEEFEENPSIVVTSTAHVNEEYIPSAVEKGDEWLDQVGEHQDMLERYPDATFVTPTGLVNDEP